MDRGLRNKIKKQWKAILGIHNYLNPRGLLQLSHSADRTRRPRLARPDADLVGTVAARGAVPADPRRHRLWHCEPH